MAAYYLEIMTVTWDCPFDKLVLLLLNPWALSGQLGPSASDATLYWLVVNYSSYRLQIVTYLTIKDVPPINQFIAFRQFRDVWTVKGNLACRDVYCNKSFVVSLGYWVWDIGQLANIYVSRTQYSKQIVNNNRDFNCSLLNHLIADV